MSKKITVLGGRGFIGSHLVSALLSRGDEVTVFGRNLDAIGTHASRTRQIQGTLDDQSQLAEAIMGADVVCHLVSSTVPSTSNADPAGDIRSNLLGTLSVINVMLNLRVEKIIYLSSGGTVYGEPESLPVRENHPLNPRCSYGVVKVAIENYLTMYQHLHGLKPTVLRASNPYGPGQTHSGVQGLIGTILGNAQKSKDIDVWGDGSITRDYIYIDDLVSLVLSAIDSPETGTFNAGSGVGHSVNEVIEEIRSLTGRPLHVRYKEGRPYDIKSIVLDIENAKSAFHWSPEYSLRSGLSKTLSSEG